MIYFTSDTHFWHKNIIEFCKRPYGDVEQMNEELIRGWNLRVQPTDTVFFLGDFAFCGKQKGVEIFNRLQGSKHLITGNHDHEMGAKLPWLSVKDYDVIRPEFLYEDDTGNLVRTRVGIVLMHFPILSWDGMGHGSWMLHGHCHGSLKDTGALRMDVGVDPNKMMPVSLDEVAAYMALRSVVPVDYHRVR